MGKKIAVLCMIVVTIGIFLVPRLYYECIDTRLNENRQDYMYNVNIDNALDSSEKKEILKNNECLIDVEDLNYVVTSELEINIEKMLHSVYFKEQDFSQQMQEIFIGEFVYDNICFKLIYIDQELIKTLRIGVCCFKSDTFNGFAIYDAATYEVYTVYIVTINDDYLYDYRVADGWKSIFNADEIINSKAINSMLQKTSLEKEIVYFGDMEINVYDLFLMFLKNERDGIGEAEVNYSQEIENN